MLPSLKTIGIIGGGQLGKMLIEAGKPWNIRYAILDADNCPAAGIADLHITGKLTDGVKIRELASVSDVLTYEIEHVDTETLIELEDEGYPVIPSPRILKMIQDKGLQKIFFRDNGIPTAPFELAEHGSEWAAGIQYLKGTKVAVKLRKGGYDGKGVVLMEKDSIIKHPGALPFSEPVVLEEYIENATELSVIVARDKNGKLVTFPAVEMEFDPIANLVRFLYAPAELDKQLAENAEKIALDCVRKLNGTGMFAVEMFLDQTGQIFVNEIAPRPHNSGHHTIEACMTSQYEQLNRLLLDMPLGDTSLLKPAAMLNILGAEGLSGKYTFTGLDKILSIPGIFIHLYNKAETRPKRKMGHITILGEDLEDIRKKADIVSRNLGMKPA